jgi:hypothetical protein
MNPLQIALGQIGRSSERKRSLDMLVTTADLPGSGWRQGQEIAWRSGIGSKSAPTARRAYKSGSFTALRRFWKDDPPLGLFVQLIPVATCEDAEYEVRNVRRALVPNRKRDLVRESENEVGTIDTPGVENPLVWEHLNARDDRRGYERFVSARVENVTFLVSAAAWGDGYSWDSLGAIVSAQATKIRVRLAVERAR